MPMSLTLLSLVSQISIGASFHHTCTPNSEFQMNDRVCLCDSNGQWNEASCHSRRQSCKPGQVIWQQCSQCICQEDGHFMCSESVCADEVPSNPSLMTGGIDIKRMWCIPFVSYYINCSLCVCPASGKMKEARCASDATCAFRGVTDYMAAVTNRECIPKVMYLFPCLHCLCSDDGFFVHRKCMDMCKKVNILDDIRRCIPKTLYRQNCNICLCPENGKTDEKLCTKSSCNHRIKFQPLQSLKNKTSQCEALTFTGPKCFYCECSDDGTINEMSCFESECFSINNFKYNLEKVYCNPGEIIPKCIDCLCLRNGFTNPNFCTKTCSYRQKVLILDISVKQSVNGNNIFDIKLLRQSITNECTPNSIYKKNGNICVCPENGQTDEKLCTPVLEGYKQKPKLTIKEPKIEVDINMKCNPNTFVEFDCNTCYCMKNGRIDPKWCTYDDCKAKKLILEKQRNEKIHEKKPNIPINGECVPGSISKEECNFCICSDTGQYKDRACTKNTCVGVHDKANSGIFCEPLAYYNVDCNICFCPKNGIKNVAKCTKNTCEKNFLRSEICVPGKLFSEECNVCVCPPNGDKTDRVCTNNTCLDTDAPWKKIFQMSQSLLSYQKMADTTRDLELCFPGEEFEIGCKLCLCPDMGLRLYATCTEILCNNEKDIDQLARESAIIKESTRTRREEICISNSTETKECTPGSMYIIRCKECICPYIGDADSFCRPLPQGFHCEEPYALVHIRSMRRSNGNGTTTVSPELSTADNTSLTNQTVSPAHTAWTCDKAGRIMDECFICECDNGIIIQEHCFKSESKKCFNKTPTFFLENKRLYKR